jgi:hypothetical protein
LSIAITEEVYAHLLDEKRDEAAAKRATLL